MYSAKTPLISLITKQLRIMLVLMLVFSFGIGTIIVQVLGWATMIPNQLAQTGSLEQAVENTFSGEHPCPMCKLAAMKSEIEQSPAPSSPEKKDTENKFSSLISVRLLSIQLYPPTHSLCSLSEAMLHLSSLGTPPPCPPPDFFVEVI